MNSESPTMAPPPSASDAWRQANQSYPVPEGRPGSHSLAVFNYCYSDQSTGIALYSLDDQACYDLPRIATIPRGSIHAGAKFVTLDGKIYILGGLVLVAENTYISTDEVYVLDVAGKKPWRRCAGMIIPRHYFGCGAFNGKIYVFGGVSGAEDHLPPLADGEVYDPEANTWTMTTRMPGPRFHNDVGVLGGEVVVYGGRGLCPSRLPPINSRTPPQFTQYGTSHHLYFYNPLQDSWRSRSIFHLYRTFDIYERLFISEGHLFSMLASYIFIFDLENDTKTRYHDHSAFIVERIADTPRDAPRAILALDGDFLAIIKYEDRGPSRISEITRENLFSAGDNVSLLRGRCFNWHRDEHIVWDKVNCSSLFTNRYSFEFLLSPFIVAL